MAQYTCNANMAADLLPMLAKRRLPFSLVWPRPDVAIFEGDPRMIELIKAEAAHLNMTERGLTIAPTDKWGIWDDMTFPLSSPLDLREGFDPTSNLNMWEDATHQITFDEGKHWTNVKLDDADPPYFVACSDGKTAWPVAGLAPYRVVKRPIAPLTREQESTVNGILAKRPDSYGTVTGRISGLDCKPTTEVHCTAHVDYDPASRKPASVGESPACGFLDTEFDSDPSVVGE